MAFYNILPSASSPLAKGHHQGYGFCSVPFGGQLSKFFSPQKIWWRTQSMKVRNHCLLLNPQTLRRSGAKSNPFMTLPDLAQHSLRLQASLCTGRSEVKEVSVVAETSSLLYL